MRALALIVFAGIDLLSVASWGDQLSQRGASQPVSREKVSRQPNAPKNPATTASTAQTGRKGGALPPKFSHQSWGRTTRGDGFVFGQTRGTFGVAVADIDRDQDYDFVFRPDYFFPPQVIRNLGTSGAFVPGGLKSIDASDPDEGVISPFMEIDDVNYDGLPDLVAVVWIFSDSMGRLVLFLNEGALTQPKFVPDVVLYESTQVPLPILAPKLVDFDNDGLIDIVFVEPQFNTNNGHRIFLIRNTGSRTAPNWETPIDVPELSALMPPLAGSKALKSLKPSSPALEGTMGQKLRSAQLKGGLVERVSDIEMADWDVDGDLDFMFYDATEGIHWIENLGTRANPEWDSQVTSQGDPLFDQSLEDLEFEYGSFALRTNPNLVGADWLDDWFISADALLTTSRYFLSQRRYRVIDRTVMAYFAGQGPTSFWDYDGDGDLDMFRGGVGGVELSTLLLFFNEGTPYSPVWGDFVPIDAVVMGEGTAANAFRQDAHTFADFDNDGFMEFFVQGQDGRVNLYFADPPAPGETIPIFEMNNPDFGQIVLSGHTGVIPGGIAFGNFDGNSAGKLQMIAAYQSEQGGRLVYYDPAFDFFADISDVLLLEDETVLSPNLIEDLAAGDLDLDGRPDLIVTISYDFDYFETDYLVYRNTPDGEGGYYFDLVGRLDDVYETDSFSGRFADLADVDSDGDLDLFVAHQYVRLNDPNLGTNRSRYLRFYRNDNDPALDFFRFRVVSGQSWDFFWNGERPNYRFVSNVSGGSISPPNHYTAGPVSRVVDVIETTDLDRNVRTFVEVLPPLGIDESKAVIVVGGDPDDGLYDTFLGLAGFAYWVLRLQGLPRQSIRAFADASGDIDGDGADDIFGLPTINALQTAITDWAADADRLLIYFIDHGQRDRYRVNATQYLDAATLGQWLDSIQAGGGGPQVTTVIDTCESGTFLDDLALSKDLKQGGARRITITSANGGPTEGIALFDRSTFISFSLSFWRDIYNGRTYGEAFRQAKISIEAINPLQRPQIDDDGDGIGNEANDGLLASVARPGSDFAVPGTSVFIGEVTPSRAIAQNSLTLYLADVVSDFPIEEAGALIVPPNFQRPSAENDDEQPISNLEWVPFTFNTSQDRWEANFSGFTSGGLYRVQFYVRALGQYFASPRVSFIDRVNVPDAWETDNTFNAARWIPINSVQGHNFHVANDQDWVRFISITGQTATIAVVAPGPNNQPVLELYRAADLEANPGAAPVRQMTSPERGQELILEHTFTTTEKFFIRVRNADGSRFGEGTSYFLIVAVGTGGIVPTTLIVTVVDRGSNSPLPDAQVEFDNSVVTATTSDGVAQFIVPAYGPYRVKANKSGFSQYNSMITVNNTIESVRVALGGAEGEGEGEGPRPCGGTVGPDGQSVSRLADGLIAVAMGLALWAGHRRRRTAPRS